MNEVYIYNGIIFLGFCFLALAHYRLSKSLQHLKLSVILNITGYLSIGGSSYLLGAHEFIIYGIVMSLLMIIKLFNFHHPEKEHAHFNHSENIQIFLGFATIAFFVLPPDYYVFGIIGAYSWSYWAYIIKEITKTKHLKYDAITTIFIIPYVINHELYAFLLLQLLLIPVSFVINKHKNRYLLPSPEEFDKAQ